MKTGSMAMKCYIFFLWSYYSHQTCFIVYGKRPLVIVPSTAFMYKGCSTPQYSLVPRPTSFLVAQRTQRTWYPFWSQG